MGQSEEGRLNKKWKPQEILFLKENIEKEVSWLANQLGRSEGSVITMIWKVKNDRNQPISSTLSNIKTQWDNKIKVTTSDPLKQSEKKSDNNKPVWKIQFDRALNALMSDSFDMTQERVIKELSYALTFFQSDTKLQNCPTESIYNSLLDIGRTKISLNPAQKLAYIIERDGKCIFEISYRGLCKILTDSGSVKIIDSFIVYEDDELFDYNPAENTLSHKPKLGFSESDNNKRKVIGAYSRAILPDDMKHFHFVEIYKLEKIERMSNSHFYGDWRLDMYKKTAIRSHYKFLPKKDYLPQHIHDAIILDEENMNMDLSGGGGKNKKKRGMMEFFSSNDSIE